MHFRKCTSGTTRHFNRYHGVSYILIHLGAEYDVGYISCNTEDGRASPPHILPGEFCSGFGLQLSNNQKQKQKLTHLAYLCNN